MTDAFEDIWIGDGDLAGLTPFGLSPPESNPAQSSPRGPHRPVPPAPLARRARALLAQQRQTWDLARQGYESLDRVCVRSVDVGGYPVRVQWNPGRRRSSSAKVDARSIEARPCFLCAAHLPPGQRAVPFGEAYAVLVNPFPIAAEHLTVPARRHQPQKIARALANLLSLARELSPLYTAFYNGPRCGASAPDHLHFQAIPSGFMPLDGEFEALRASHGEASGACGGVRVSLLDRLPCRCVALEGEDLDAMIGVAARLLASLDRDADHDEPMVNITASYTDGWRMTVIPRARHRPSFYDAEGTEGFLLSPATVDLGGVCITPRQEDFERLEGGHLRAMFDEVCAPAAALRRAVELLTAVDEEGAIT